jgi:hypothetical protein
LQKNPQPSACFLALHVLQRSNKSATSSEQWLLLGHLWTVNILWGRKASQKNGISPHRKPYSPLCSSKAVQNTKKSASSFGNQLLEHMSISSLPHISWTAQPLRLWWKKPCKSII